MGNNNQNLKEIRTLGSEKIAPRTDGRTDDGQKPHTMSSADSQAELKKYEIWNSLMRLCANSKREEHTDIFLIGFDPKFVYVLVTTRLCNFSLNGPFNIGQKKKFVEIIQYSCRVSTFGGWTRYLKMFR